MLMSIAIGVFELLYYLLERSQFAVGLPCSSCAFVPNRVRSNGIPSPVLTLQRQISMGPLYAHNIARVSRLDCDRIFYG